VNARAELAAIERAHPEWAQWIARVRTVVRQAADESWDAEVPRLAPPAAGAPVLAGATLHRHERAGRFLCELARAAGLRSAPDVAALLAALNGEDCDRCDAAGAAIAALAVVPLLHASRRRFADRVPRGWTAGYCPVCAAWPAFAEVCGVERTRFLRCGRCAAGWEAAPLRCPFCGMHDHTRLASLVVEGAGPAVELCEGCRSALKVFTTLQPAAPGQLLLDDLASVDLDLAAAARGYGRPRRAGHPLNVTLA
jgi:FdhE protein